MFKKIFLPFIVLMLVLWLAGCNGASQTSSHCNTSSTPAAATTVQPISTNSVSIQGFQFTPGTITIKKGETVTWANKDPIAHTVTGTGFASGSLAQGATYKHTYNQAGTFNYICSYHPYMKGQVIVH